MLCTDHGPTVVYTTTKRCTTLFYCTVITPNSIKRTCCFSCTILGGRVREHKKLSGNCEVPALASLQYSLIYWA